MTKPSSFDAVRIGDAARELGITEDHLRDLCNKGKIPHTTTPGGHRLFDPRELQIIRSHGLETYLQIQRTRKATIPNRQGEYPTIEVAEGQAKRSTLTTCAPFLLLDAGRLMQVLWGVASGNKLRQPPTAEAFALHANQSQLLKVRSITLVVDPLVMDPAWSPELRASALRSYTAGFSALLAGQLMLSGGTPEVVNIPVDRLRVLSPLGSTPDVISQQVDLCPGPLPAEAEAVLRGGGEMRVFLDCPTRALEEKGYSEIVEDRRYLYSWAWSGLVQIAYEVNHTGGYLELTANTPAAPSVSPAH